MHGEPSEQTVHRACRVFIRRRRRLIVLVSLALAYPGCDELPARTDVVCSASTYQTIEARVPVEDDEGHGPDVGSTEWKHAIEAKLRRQHEPQFPPMDSDAWCQRVYDLVLAIASNGPRLTGTLQDEAAQPAIAPGSPTWDCSRRVPSVALRALSSACRRTPIRWADDLNVARSRDANHNQRRLRNGWWIAWDLPARRGWQRSHSEYWATPYPLQFRFGRRTGRPCVR